MPRRAPIDPQGYYHVGTRGSYGQPLFRTASQYELFLGRYGRTAVKYGWTTLEWVLMRNHHHFVIKLADGGLSEGMREVHGGYSRQIHSLYGVTGQGHLVRHAFFARRLQTDDDVVGTCQYVSLNFSEASGRPPEASPWGGYRALVGFEHPRRFHTPAGLLELLSPSQLRAQELYRKLVAEELEHRRATRVAVPAPYAA